MPCFKETMLLNIEATTRLLRQVVTPNTFLASLTTLDGRVIAYYIHPSAVVAQQDEERDGTDQVKNLAAVASGLWRESSFSQQQQPQSATSSSDVSRSNSQDFIRDQNRKLDVQCELGQLHITFTPPFLLLVVGKTGSVSFETLSIKSKLLQDQLKGPFSKLI